MPRPRILCATLAQLCFIVLQPALSGAQPQTKDQQKCTNAMNQGLLKVSSAITSEIHSCLKDGAKGELGESLEACAASDRSGKVAKAESKTNDAFGKKCTGNSKRPPGVPKTPPYGVTGPATVHAAAATHASDLFRDAFGPSLDVAIASEEDDKPTSLCQRTVASALTLCRDAKMREFNRCKKAGLKSEDAPIEDATGIESCMGQDAKGKIAKACDLREEVKPGKFKVDGIRKALAKRCAGGVDLERAFPGCGPGDSEAAHACLERAAECRFCLAANQADGLARDCDLFDDGASNGSCPFAIGEKTCSLSEDSAFLFDSAAGFVLDVPEGSVRLTCGPPDPATGQGQCRCDLESIAPIRIPGVGWACITGFEGCGLGEISCNGGNSLDFSIDADHNAGTCTSNANCAAQCETACGSPAEVFDSGCEGFCEGGTRDGLSCTARADCPNGTCNGVAGGGHGNVCQCQCIDYTGDPSREGGIRCPLGVNVRVEAALPCDRSDVVIDVGQRCVPFTTESSRAILRDQDNVSGEELPPGGENLFGEPLACTTLATSGTSGLFLSSTFNAFDLPRTGDASLLFVLGCE